MITVNGTPYEVSVEELNDESSFDAVPVNTQAAASLPKRQQPPAELPAASASAGATGAKKVESPMPGTIVKVNISAGNKISKGEVAIILEAMKMENEITAPDDGVVAAVNVTAGSNVDTGTILFTYN